jgi:hypothetical protein
MPSNQYLSVPITAEFPVIPCGAVAPGAVFLSVSFIFIREGGREGGAVAGIGGALSCWVKSHAEARFVSSPSQLMKEVQAYS